MRDDDMSPSRDARRGRRHDLREALWQSSPSSSSTGFQSHASEIIEAETLFEACTKAIESDHWRKARIDYESAGPTHVVLAVLGAYANAYDAPSCDVLRVPREFAAD